MSKLSESVALVTGGARGLGKAICEALLKKGLKGVCILDILEKEGLETERLLKSQYGDARVVFVPVDTTCQESTENAFKKCLETFGRLDIVSCNAAIISETNWERTMAVNLGGTIRCTRLGITYMSKQNGHDGGVIVNTSSILAFATCWEQPVYAATKWAVAGYTISCSENQVYRKAGIRFNCLCPGTLDTPMAREFTLEQLGNKETFESLREQCEKCDYIQPEDVAERFLSLVEDDSLNGESMVVAFNREPISMQPSLKLSDFQ